MKVNSEIIEKKFSKSQDALVLQQSDLSLQSISDMVVNGAIDISPKYQRRERWDSKKESDLIESFILNIPVPPIYLAEDSYGTYSVIDGKQRITAINNFLTSEIKLHNLEHFKELEGLSFENLPNGIKNALKIRPYLRVVTLLRQSDNELKHEVFLRLNKAGVALNNQEIRNVAFRGKFNDLLFELSENKYFKKILKSTSSSKIYREMIDVQYILRFFTVRQMWDNFPGNMDQAMDSFMQTHFKCDDSEITKLREIFIQALNSCEEIWGDDAFLKPGATRRVLQGFYDIEMVCLSLLSPPELEKVKSKPQKVKNILVDELNKNKNFLDSTTQFTSNAKNIEYRISHFLDLIKGI